MSQEIPVQKDSLGHWRRWHTDGHLDIIIWYHDEMAAKVRSFQIILKVNERNDEIMISWDKALGFEISGKGNIDGGEQAPHKNSSPLLVPKSIDLNYSWLINEIKKTKTKMRLSDWDEFFILSRISEHGKVPLE